MMKNYLLSLLCVSGAILAMAGLSAQDYKKTLEEAEYKSMPYFKPVKIQQGDKVIVAGKGGITHILVARFNKDGSMDKSFGDTSYGTIGKGFGRQINPDSIRLEVLANKNIKISGLTDPAGDKVSFEVTSEGKEVPGGYKAPH